MFIHDFSPYLIQTDFLTIKWYGLMFAIGLMLYIMVSFWIWRREKLSENDFFTLIIMMIIGLVAGARIGYILFYNLDFYLTHPANIVRIWEGGLSSHGATIGLLLAYLIFYMLKKSREPDFRFSKYADLLVIAVPLAAACVRLGNFINGEIVGRVTEMIWGVVFVEYDKLTRHPVQLYESVVAMGIFLVMLWVYKKYYHRLKPYFMFFFFFLTYFGTRFFLEFFKDYQGLAEEEALPWGLTMGQALSLAPIVISIIFFMFIYPKIKKSSISDDARVFRRYDK